jgi:hypothetical protein
MERSAEHRVGRNEGIFREANEAIERGLWPGQEHGAVRFRCECARLECNSAIELTVSEYERVRRNPRWFVVLLGHEVSEVDVVVERRPGYVVVEKRGPAGSIAENEDPRA